MRTTIKLLLIFLITLSSICINAAELLPVPRQRYFDANGLPLVGGKLFSYEAGTSTPKATYTDRSGATANANPVILDSNGEANVWIGSGYYKFVLKDSSDVTQWTIDQVSTPSEAALASAFWRGVVYITNADSPFTINTNHNGKLISVDTTAGAVTVNMPEISSVVLPFNIGVKLTAGSNAVTITRSGTDTIDGGTSKTLSTPNAAAQLIGDLQKSPDDWSSLDIGVVSDGGVTTAKLNDSVFHGLTAVTATLDDYAPIADTSDSNKKKKALVSDFKNRKVRSVTTTDSPSNTADEVLLLSGASFTVTLPTAVGNTGKIFNLIHSGTNISQAYTLNTTSSQTIGGVASGSYVLYTTGESLTIMSDGANWIILDHFTSATWTVSGMTIGATTTGPTKATTREYDVIQAERQGRYGIFTYRYYASSATGAAAGSGTYLFSLPNSLAIDTGLQPTTSSSVSDTTANVGLSVPESTAVFRSNTGPSAADRYFIAFYNSTQFFVLGDRVAADAVFTIGSTAFALTEVVSYLFQVKVPISGWQP